MSYEINPLVICDRAPPGEACIAPRFRAPAKFFDWRRSGIPEFSYKPLPLDLQGIAAEQQGLVRAICLEEYRRSNLTLDQAIADAALRYVHAEGTSGMGPGPIAKLAETFSLRILELYGIYAHYEAAQGIPMVPVDAGQLKNHGFVSPEILRMQESCKSLGVILEALRGEFKGNDYEKAFKTLTSAEGRADYLKNGSHPLLLKAIHEYEGLKEKGLIDRACLMMIRFGRCAVSAVEVQLEDIARMVPVSKADPYERFLMEIRHRMAGDGFSFNANPGYLGTNPHAYLNVILDGEPGHPHAEFRSRMYFVYMNNHFINACMQDPKFIQFANQELLQRSCGWQIDPEFVKAMEAREPKFLPPIFRYGENAALNTHLRESLDHPSPSESEENPLLFDVVAGNCSLDASFRHPLSRRELLNQVGDYEIETVPPFKRIKLLSGGTIFRMKKAEEVDDSQKGMAAKEYLSMCRELRLPSLASISGTFDQTAAMAGFVGVAQKQEELQDLKLSMIAFMVPARDHTVHEILQSTKSYNLPYEPGPGFERYIYPCMGDRFLKQVESEMEKRGADMPAYYLTAEFVNKVYQSVTQHD